MEEIIQFVTPGNVPLSSDMKFRFKVLLESLYIIMDYVLIYIYICIYIARERKICIYIYICIEIIDYATFNKEFLS